MPQTPLAPHAAIAPSPDDARERSLNEDLHQLAQDARIYAEAELAYQKARASYAASAAKSIVVFAVIAAVLVFFAVMAFVVGLVIALGTLITPWGSMVVVTAALLAISVMLLLKAKRRVSRLLAAIGDGKQPDA